MCRRLTMDDNKKSIVVAKYFVVDQRMVRARSASQARSLRVWTQAKRYINDKRQNPLTFLEVDRCPPLLHCCSILEDSIRLQPGMRLFLWS